MCVKLCCLLHRDDSLAWLPLGVLPVLPGVSRALHAVACANGAYQEACRLLETRQDQLAEASDRSSMQAGSTNKPAAVTEAAGRCQPKKQQPQQQRVQQQQRGQQQQRQRQQLR
jgi:hypothetical protein